MELKTFFAQDLMGNVISSPTVTVYQPDTVLLATGLQDAAGLSLSNPFTGTTSGRVVLAAPDGDYDIKIEGADLVTTMRVRFIDSVAGSAEVLRLQLAEEDGADRVGYGVETVQDALDARLPEIANYAALRAYSGPVTAYYVRGVANIFDGGAGVFRVDAADTTTADNGGTVLVDASGRRWKREFADKVNVRWFGAVGNGAADDTADIQAAIDATPVRGALYFPAGIYKVSASLLVNRSDITLYGESNTSTYILRTDGAYGDTITVASSDPDNVAISGVVIRDMRIQCNADMTNGAHIHLVNVAASFFTNLTLMNGFRGFWLEGVRTSHFTTTLIQAGTYAATARVGSAYVYVGLPRTPALENTEVFFSDFNWEFAGTPRRIENGLVIQECDGLWFSNGHIFGASNADLHIFSSASSDQVLATIFDNVWFDQQCSRNLHVSGNGSLFGLTKFTSCRFTGADDYNVLVSPSSTMQGLSFFACDFGVGQLHQSVDLFSGNNVSFNACRFEQIDAASSSVGDAFIFVRGTSTLAKLAVSGCTFIGDSKLQHGMQLLNSTTEYFISGNSFVDFSTVAGEEIYTNQTVLNGSIDGNSTDRTFNIAATAGSQYVTAVCKNANLTGASVNINTIVPHWEGREINFRADTNSKVFEESTGNIVTAAGGNYTLPASRGTKFTYFKNNNRWVQL